jgi:hypothetical protein
MSSVERSLIRLELVTELISLTTGVVKALSRIVHRLGSFIVTAEIIAAPFSNGFVLRRLTNKLVNRFILARLYAREIIEFVI